jgi:hypothetical protein
MPNFFDTFSLGQSFAQDSSLRALQRVARSITGGGALFDKILLNDERMREQSKSHKEGVDWDKERLSTLISKVQNLQARLQAVYQSMNDRIMCTNSAEAATNQEFTDPWTDTQWRVAGGRLPLLFSRGSHADGDLEDDLSRNSNNLGRAHFWRPVANGSGQLYEERAGFYTTAAYLNQWDMHHLNIKYETGSEPAVADQVTNVTQDNKVQVVAVDYAKSQARNWKLGDVIPLDPNDIFTPEFMQAPGIGGTKGYSDIVYQNGSGYQFKPNVPIYAYVREVEYYPDNVTLPTVIDMITGPTPIDANGDGVPDNTVQMETYLRHITDVNYDFNLRDDYNFSGTSVNGWTPDTPQAYHFNDDPWFSLENGGTGFDHSVWAGSHWQGSGFWGGLGSGQWDDTDATFRKSWQFANDPLRHPTFSYDASTFGWNVQIDDFGHLNFFNGTSWQTWMIDNVAGSPGTGIAGTVSSMGLVQGVTNQFELQGWNRLASKIWRGLTLPPTAPWPDHNDYQDYNGNWGETPDGLGVPTYEFRGGTWRDGGAGMQIDNGNWTFKTIEPESAPGANDGDLNLQGTDRYTIDRYGNIYDKFGTGNAKADFYDYTLTNSDLLDNGKMNYVGNIFGGKQRVAQRTKVDTNASNTLTGAELRPVLEFAERDYNKKDETIVLPPVGSMTAPFNAQLADQAINGSFGTTVLDTYNPGFAGKYIGYTEAPTVTIGTAAVSLDAYGRSLNTLNFQAFRTGGSLTTSNWATTGNDALDRDYTAIAPGATVNITDANGTVLDANATISAKAADGSYTVTPSAAFKLQLGKSYKVTLPPIPDARTGGTIENGMANILKGVLTGSEYRDALKAGLMDDLMLSASSTDMFGGMILAKLSLSYNKRQERMELFQNSFATIFKAEKPKFPS